LIRSTDKINSYCLAELSDACVTYTSQIGAEIAALGRPLIIAGDAFYKNKGFGITPDNDLEYYFRLSDEFLLDGFRETDKETALRYEHFLYFKQHYPLKIIHENASKGMGVVEKMDFIKMDGNNMMVDLEMIKNDLDLKRIQNYILEGIKDEYDVQMLEVA
jgi:hypothetical protein